MILDSRSADLARDDYPSVDKHGIRESSLDISVSDTVHPDGIPVPGSEATSYAINPAHDNLQPSDSISSPLTPKWKAQLPGAVGFPVVAKGRVIVWSSGTQSGVRALDLGTGAAVWGPIGLPATPPFNENMLAYDAGRVFVLEGDGHLTALDVTSGKQLWTNQLKGQSSFLSPPVATGGLVYVNGLGVGGTTFAVDGQTGLTVWTAATFDGSQGSVAVAGGVVYEAEACDQMSAFEALTGKLKWYASTNCTGGGGAAPAVYQGLIWERDWAKGDIIYDLSGKKHGTFSASVVPSFHGGTAYLLKLNKLSAVDIQTLTANWSFVGDGSLCTSAVVAGAGNQVFVGSSAGNVYEIDAVSGAQRSVHNLGGTLTCGSETHAMALASGHLFVPAGNTLVVY